MKFSSRIHYGMRVLCDLAAAYPGQVSLRQIAEEEGLSMKYLEQIAGRLRTAGLVRATSGMHGGYSLNRSPEDIHVTDAYQALEGPARFAFCLEGAGDCARARKCQTRCLWLGLNDVVLDVLSSTSVADLMTRGGRAAQVRRRQAAKPRARAARG